MLLYSCLIRCFEVSLLIDDFLVKQIQSLEESAESLRERGLKFYKGCRKYTYVYAYVFQNYSLTIHSVESSEYIFCSYY
jgi:hypothetical protein